MEKVFRSLTKRQYAIMDVLCAIQHPVMAAASINPTTLGSLCAKKLVNVKSGVVCSNCVMLWNMTFHKEMFDMISKECIDKIGLFIRANHRISAIRVLREYTGWGIHKAKLWVDFNYTLERRS